MYPSYRYHRTEAPRIVNDPNEDDALGSGWADSPAAFEIPEVTPDAPEPAPKKKVK